MIISQFNTTIDYWISSLNRYDLELLKTQPSTDSWSMGQLYKHLIDETGFFLEQAELCLKIGDNSNGEMTEEAQLMFAKNSFPDKKIKGDQQVAANLPQPSTKEELRSGMMNLRVKGNTLWQKVERSSDKGKTKHPGLGYFNARQWLQYAEMHMRHHFSQKQRIENVLGKQNNAV